MSESQLTPANSDWTEQIKVHAAEIEALSNRLVEAEAELAERLAGISAFEFELRSRIGHLTVRLDALEEEIQGYRKVLRWIGDAWEAQDSDAAAWARSAGAAEGDYRYRQPAAAVPPPDLNEAQQTAIKQLYRQLARRFHPDMGLNEADREYRTQIMMAINAAYAAGDLARLQELALEPDTAQRPEFAQNDQQRAEALAREVVRMRRRLQEIERELARLERHQSAQLLRRQQKAAAEGRDWFAEVLAQLRESIAARMVERDVLKGEIENLDAAETAVPGADFADVVLDVTLDQTFEEDYSPEFDRYIQRRRDRVYFEDDFDDDYDLE